MRVFNTMGVLILFFFLSKLMAPDSATGLTKYGGDYFAFAVIGLALAGFFQLTLKLFSESIRTAQMNGCLEAMVSSQTDPMAIVLMSSLYGLLLGAFELGLVLVLASLAFGFDLSQANVPASALVFVLSTFSFVSFGVLSAATIVWMKKGDPISWLFTRFGAMLGGAYFPTDVMPEWLQKIAEFLPIFYSLDALRLTLLQGYSISMVARPTIILALMTLVLFPLSLWVFAISIRTGKREGTLIQY